MPLEYTCHSRKGRERQTLESRLYLAQLIWKGPLGKLIRIILKSAVATFTIGLSLRKTHGGAANLEGMP